MFRRAITFLLWLATASAFMGWLLLRQFNDANPVGMLLGFAPRWWCVLPWLLLLPLALMAGWRTRLGALAGALVTLFGIAQFEIPRGLGRRPPGDFRLVTYNTDFSYTLASRLRADLARWNAQLVLLQDCKPGLADSLRAVMPHAVSVGHYCFGSSWPIVAVHDTRSLLRSASDMQPERGAIRFVVQSPFGRLPVYSVHFPSPRDGLSAARWLNTPALVPSLRRSLEERSRTSAVVSSIVSREAPAFVVAGDFNLPYGSAMLRRDWGDLTNAFAHAGTGFGYTMQAGIFPVRIDHVLVPHLLEPVAATVLAGYPSEHQPLLVDLAWRGAVSGARPTPATR